MTTDRFELDLLDFHGEPLELHFEVPGGEAEWLLADIEAAIKIDTDLPFRAELDAQLVGDTVRIDGQITGAFYYRCGRCLEWRELRLDEDVEFVLMSRASWEASYEGQDEIGLGEEDLNVSFYEDEIIDLRPLLREAVLLELPSFPVCPDELSDACDEAYERLVGDEKLAENEAQSMDLRWSKLRELKLSDDDE